ncbi:MAG: antitoxin VapB family protein [Halolamina sp.]
MATADEQIRVSDRVKSILDRRRAEGESYNDVLERVLDEALEANFEDGFGRWSDEEADTVREHRQQAKTARKERMRRLAGEGEDAGV